MESIDAQIKQEVDVYALGIQVAYLNPVGEQPCQLEALSISTIVTGNDVQPVEMLLPALTK